jgi:two-component system LytT family sensor kinase
MKNAHFKVSPGIIWISSLALGLLSSLPKVAEHPFNAPETLLNSGITFLFALFAWYFNIYALPRYTSKQTSQGFSYSRLVGSLSLGVIVMFGLSVLQQLILSNIHFGPVMLMVEIRGILINLVFYMFLHLLYQNYENQQVNVELERAKVDNLEAQYELLKQQINPHFLFNSLTTLKAMVESEDRHTADFVQKLAEFYRFTLESRKQDMIHVSEEMRIVSAYLFLLKQRFEEGFTFANTLDEAVLGTLIPPFTLQLMIENCIKHNVVSLERPLHIRLYSEGDKLIIENQRQPKKTEEASLGVGLKNIDLRYRHLLDKKIEIIVSDKTFTIKLPIVHEYHSH